MAAVRFAILVKLDRGNPIFLIFNCLDGEAILAVFWYLFDASEKHAIR